MAGSARGGRRGIPARPRTQDDGGRAYLARTWLIDEARTQPRKGGSTGGGSREPWNEQDWYVSFGEETGNRSWEDARTYGFVSAGGGEWFSRTLRKLPVGGRVFACIPGVGYVGVGTVTGGAMPFDEAVLPKDDELVRLSEQPLAARYQHSPLPDGEDHREYVVPVDWQDTRSREQAFWTRGMFANQNSACKLRNRFTLEQLATAFGLDD